MVEVNPEVPFRGDRPDNFILGVFNERQQMQAAVSELEISRYTEEPILILHGEGTGEALRRRGEHDGSNSRIGRIRNKVEEFGSGGMDDVQRHIEAAHEGKYVIGVILASTEEEDRERVRNILKAHNSYDIVLIGRDIAEMLEW
jgi:hypothetical protein